MSELRANLTNQKDGVIHREPFSKDKVNGVHVINIPPKLQSKRGGSVFLPRADVATFTYNVERFDKISNPKRVKKEK